MSSVRVIRLFLWGTVFVYFLVLVKFLILDRITYSGIGARLFNVYPFHSIKQYILNRDSYNFNTWAMNLFGNLFMLFPYGVLLPMLFKQMRRAFRFLVSLIGFNLFIEVFQYLTMLGSFDVDDMILNSTGAVAGYLFSTSLLTIPLIKQLLDQSAARKEGDLPI
ncbi:VanZ family protein [Paenibacillus sp. S-38]|uniref:VanZ family protein n=1 Tax=Paenibacillus sp. S-38 TaxID=3416710 RepID=UPI003CE97CF1